MNTYKTFISVLVLYFTSSDLCCDNAPSALDGSVVKHLLAPSPLGLLVNQLKLATAAPL